MPLPCYSGAAIRFRRSSGCKRVAVYLPAALRKQLLDADDHRCVYCGTPQANSGSPMVIDHILARSKGGDTVFENLCFACYRCNLYKGPHIEAIDAVSGVIVPLFHPRKDRWDEHFTWDESYLYILGVTAIGRATVTLLRMNNTIIVDARRNWVRLGWRPVNL